MTLTGVERLVRALTEAKVRYLVAGGLAVNAHGVARFTKDVDLVVELERANILAAFSALTLAGWQPIVPISAEQFADEDLRTRLSREKNMQVLQFWSDEYRETPVDVFVREPFVFAEEMTRATERDLPGAGHVRFVSCAR